MTMEPSDAETCLHVSVSEANMSSPVRGMTVLDFLSMRPTIFRGSFGVSEGSFIKNGMAVCLVDPKE